MLALSETSISWSNVDFLQKNVIQSSFDILNVVFADDNMYFQIPPLFLHKESSMMQTLPMNLADLE